MPRDLSLLQRCVLVTVVMMIVGNYGVDRAAANGVAAAKAVPFAGSAADRLLALNSNPQALVAGGQEGTVLALVPGMDLDDARQRLDALKMSGEVEKCPLGDCCDAKNKVYVLYAEFEDEHFWLNLRERCEGWPPEERVNEGAPVGEAEAEVVKVPPGFMAELAGHGVIHPFMSFATETGGGRILDDPSYDSSLLELPPAMLDRPWFKQRSSIVLAGHVVSSDPKCVGAVSSCKQESGRRCNEGRRHWFSYNNTRAKWCQTADTCTCP